MGNLKGRNWRCAAALVATLGVLVGCDDARDSAGDRHSPIGQCPDGTNPDFLTDADNCGACGVRCDDLHGAAMCQAGICRLAEPVACNAGFFDVDGNPSNGCECAGATARTCRTCLAYEVPMNGIDDDCNPSTTDLGPGALADVPVTRAHCGAHNASCALPPGSADVVCELVTCSPSQAARGECGVCEGFADDGSHTCGKCIGIGEQPGFEAPQDCFDGIDQDGNGRVDDGPYCEVLLANAATPECNLAPPRLDCPPNVVQIPSDGSPLPTLDVGLTYDVLYDRYEVTRAQFAVYLQTTGQCEPDFFGRVPSQCAVTDDERRLPVSEVTWCAAYDYCAWAGKRLPTAAEYYRAASADIYGGDDAIDAQGPARADDELCAGRPSAVLPECAALGVERVDSGAGVALVGHPEGRPDDVLRSLGIHHLTGNVAEWLFDAAVDWCADEGPHALPEFRDITCPAVGDMVQRRLLLDWAPSPADRPDGDLVLRAGQQRLMCGGGWASTPGAAGYGKQQRITPGVRAAHHGFRCARTFHPDPALADNWPYEREVDARARAICDPLPVAGVSARTTLSARAYRAVDACIPHFDRQQTAGLYWRVSQSLVSVLMTIDGKDDEAHTVRLQAGLNAGAEQLWLGRRAPVSATARVPAACNDQRCEVLVIDPPADPLAEAPTLVVPQPFDTVAEQGLTVTDITIGRSADCLQDDGTPVRLELDVDREALARLLEVPDLDNAQLDRLAEAGLCLSTDEQGVCQRWQLTLALAFEQLYPVPEL